MLPLRQKLLWDKTLTLSLLLHSILRVFACPAAPNPVPKMDIAWQRLHSKYVGEVLQNEQAEDGKEWQVVFYGASGIERFRGTNVGQPWDTAEGVPEVFQDQMHGYRAHALGISGDETAHLLWRLQNGELGRARPPRLAVFFIGINDIFQSQCGPADALPDAAPGIIARMNQIVQYVRSAAPDTHILILALTPFSCGSRVSGQGLVYDWPNCYTETIAAVNAGYKAIAETQGDRVRFLDCSGVVLGQTGLAHTVDGLHLDPAGASAFLECIRPEVAAVMGAPASPPS
eukprot:jgi/Botrbrau1/21841/Bobra.0190s0055.1